MVGIFWPNIIPRSFNWWCIKVFFACENNIKPVPRLGYFIYVNKSNFSRNKFIGVVWPNIISFKWWCTKVFSDCGNNMNPAPRLGQLVYVQFFQKKNSYDLSDRISSRHFNWWCTKVFFACGHNIKPTPCLVLSWGQFPKFTEEWKLTGIILVVIFFFV